MGIQVWGGHGYIRDNKAEQVFRDARIAPVWEGTTQIQALDLLGRKLLAKQTPQPLLQHLSGIWTLASPHLLSSDSSLRSHSWSLLSHCAEWVGLTVRIALRARSNRDAVTASSVDYLMFSGYVSLAAHWLRMEVAASEALAKGGGVDEHGEEEGFYRAKVQTSAFVFDHLLTRTRGHQAAMLAPVDAIMAMDVADFSFDHAR